MTSEQMPQLLTTAETAALLRTSRSGLTQMRNRGAAPPGIPVGRRILYRRSEVEAWLDARTEGRG